MKHYSMRGQWTIQYETHLICHSIFYPIFLRIKQVYKHTFDFFAQDSSKILWKLSKMNLNALERWTYVGSRSPIYREVKQLRRKLQTCPQCFTHMIYKWCGGITVFSLSFLLDKSWTSFPSSLCTRSFLYAEASDLGSHLRRLRVWTKLLTRHFNRRPASIVLHYMLETHFLTPRVF